MDIACPTSIHSRWNVTFLRPNVATFSIQIALKNGLKQERKLWLKSKSKSKKNSNLKIMNKEDVINFMQTYQRITQNMFRYMPKYASIIFNLNSNHQIKSAVYKRK